jgi:hypothetical protein
MSVAKHGAALPTGVEPTNIVVDRVTKTDTDVNFKVHDQGEFEAGKSLRVETTLDVEGTQLASATMPTVGSGAYTAAAPHIDEVRTTDEGEDASKFSIRASYAQAGGGDFA